MDGNGRWAQERGLARIRGHEEGAESVRTVLRTCGEWGVEFLTLYAFSTENWKRPKAEVAALMKLLERFLRKETPELMEQNVRLQAIGRLTDLPEACQNELHRVIELTAATPRRRSSWPSPTAGASRSSTPCAACCRRGRSGPSRRGHDRPGRFQQASLYRDLSRTRTSSSGPPARCGISNFLLWQLSYTEIYVTKKLWPDFWRMRPDACCYGGLPNQRPEITGNTEAMQAEPLRRTGIVKAPISTFRSIPHLMHG